MLGREKYSVQLLEEDFKKSVVRRLRLKTVLLLFCCPVMIEYDEIRSTCTGSASTALREHQRGFPERRRGFFCLNETIDHAAPKNRLVNNVCFCAGRLMRSRTASQIDPCTASAVVAERKKSYSDTFVLSNHFIHSLFSFAFLYFRSLASHYVGNSASLSSVSTSFQL